MNPRSPRTFTQEINPKSNKKTSLSLTVPIQPTPPSHVALQTRTNMPKLTGKVKWFNKSNGFGFITPDDGSEAVYVSLDAVQVGPTTS